MIPDYVQQLQGVQCDFQTQCSITQENWNDCVSERYYDKYVDEYDKLIYKAIHGDGINGKGLDDLFVFIDNCQQEMERVTGVPSAF